MILDEILKLAKKAAEEAQKIQLKGLTEGTTIKLKGRSNDLVTSADEASEKCIRDMVKKAYPDHGFLGEESGSSDLNAEWLWIVDPIDGTTNYSRGIPYFSVSIAVKHKGETVIGIVANPVVKETFWACRGLGAFLNDKPIQCNKTTEFTKALMITGFYYDRGRNIDLTLGCIKKFYDRGIMGLRRFGSCALDLCNVAAGRADGYFEMGINAWDFSAGEFIARQAGAIVTDDKGNALPQAKTVIIAGNPGLQQQMLLDWQEVDKNL